MNNIGFGVDTIKASVALPRDTHLYQDVFDVVSTSETDTGLITRWSIKSDENETEPRITYYPRDKRLLCEVSLPKLLTGSNVYGIHTTELAQAFRKCNGYLSTLSSQPLPDIENWSIRRVDYVTGWYVNNLMLSYISAIGQRHLPRHEKNWFSRGVRWQNKTRRINLYDKFAQDGTGQGLLRCEIQNKWSAIAQLKKSTGLEPVVSNYTTERMAKSVLTFYLSQLEIDNLGTIPDDNQLREVFGRNWAQAKTYRPIINQLGIEAYKTGQMSTSSYYRYKNALNKHNLLGNAGVVALAPLNL